MFYVEVPSSKNFCSWLYPSREVFKILFENKWSNQECKNKPKRKNQQKCQKMRKCHFMCSAVVKWMIFKWLIKLIMVLYACIRCKKLDSLLSTCQKVYSLFLVARSGIVTPFYSHRQLPFVLDHFMEFFQILPLSNPPTMDQFSSVTDTQFISNINKTTGYHRYFSTLPFSWRCFSEGWNRFCFPEGPFLLHIV